MIRRDEPTPPQWPSFTGTERFAGTSGNGRVTVFVDSSLDAPALLNAQDLVTDADRIVAANDAIFGTTGGPVDVIIFALDGATDGSGGADHLGCDYLTGAAIEVCASFGDSARVSALFEAELSECSMGGNICGASTGEALSRACAAAVSNNALADFATAPLWAQRGMPNFVDRTDPTDRSPVSTGCGMAFLSWMRSTGYGLEALAPAMVALGDSGTLAQLYARLTSGDAARAWPAFHAAVQALPGVNSDDPFAQVTPPGMVSQLAPSTVDLAGKIFSAILADVAAGRPEEEIVKRVRGLLISSAPAHTRGTSSTCSTTSRRLRRPSHDLAAL